MRKLLRTTYLGSILWNFAFFLITPLILRLYDLSAEAVRLVMILVIIHNVFNATLCPTGFPMANGLRAAGDVKFNMYASIFSTVICRVLLSILLGQLLHMGVIGITLAMVGDWAIKTLLTVLRWQSGKWKAFKVI